MRVLELGGNWSGPLVGLFLRSLGAEVIRIESPNHLDTMRLLPAPRVAGRKIDGVGQEDNPYFAQLNAGKRSVTADLSTSEGRMVVLELLDDVDVLVENMAPGALERLGLGYRVLSDRNPAVCVLSLPALHPGDALGDLRGYAPVFTGMGGLEILATPVEGSRAVGMLETGWGDPNGGTVGLLGLLAALVRRARTGVGVHVICSQVKAVTWQLDRAFFRHTSPVGLRPEHGGSDGDWQVVLPVDDGGWLAVGGDPAKALTVVAGLGLTSRDLLAEWSKSRSSAEVARAFRAGGLHTAPVITAEDAARAERARVRGVAEEIDHPLLGPVARFHVPWLLDGVAPRCDGRPPALGEGAEELLRAPRDAAPERRCEHD